MTNMRAQGAPARRQERQDVVMKFLLMFVWVGGGRWGVGVGGGGLLQKELILLGYLFSNQSNPALEIGAIFSGGLF